MSSTAIKFSIVRRSIFFFIFFLAPIHIFAIKIRPVDPRYDYKQANPKIVFFKNAVIKNGRWYIRGETKTFSGVLVELVEGEKLPEKYNKLVHFGWGGVILENFPAGKLKRDLEVIDGIHQGYSREWSDYPLEGIIKVFGRSAKNRGKIINFYEVRKGAIEIPAWQKGKHYFLLFIFITALLYYLYYKKQVIAIIIVHLSLILICYSSIIGINLKALPYISVPFIFLGVMIWYKPTGSESLLMLLCSLTLIAGCIVGSEGMFSLPSIYKDLGLPEGDLPGRYWSFFAILTYFFLFYADYEVQRALDKKKEKEKNIPEEEELSHVNCEPGSGQD
ncbi:hypothetical protein ACFL35_15525 [Candidatus Riflebacteria bacterium]